MSGSAVAGPRRWKRSSPPGIARKSERSLRPMVSSCGRWGCDDRCWFPSLRSGGGTTPHTPRVSAYRRRQWVAPVKELRPNADRVSFRRVSPPTTYHLPLATPSLRSGGGTTPHTPRVSAYRRRQWVAPVKEPGPFADRVGSLPTTYHLSPTTSAFRLPIGEHEPIPVA